MSMTIPMNTKNPRTPWLMSKGYARLPLPHTSENVRLSLIAEASTAMRLLQRPHEKLVTGRSNGDARTPPSTRPQASQDSRSWDSSACSYIFGSSDLSISVSHTTITAAQSGFWERHRKSAPHMHHISRSIKPLALRITLDAILVAQPVALQGVEPHRAGVSAERCRYLLW
jgi:hypothetical protein